MAAPAPSRRVVRRPPSGMRQSQSVCPSRYNGAVKLEAERYRIARQTAAPRRTIAVIDGNSLMHRAFHAIMQPMSAPDGRSTNALFGFFNMFIKLVETFRPDGVICAFDKGKPRVRMEMLPQYKAQRPPMDPDAASRLPWWGAGLSARSTSRCASSRAGRATTSWARSPVGRGRGYEMYLLRATATCTHCHRERQDRSPQEAACPTCHHDARERERPSTTASARARARLLGLKGDTSDNIPGVPALVP